MNLSALDQLEPSDLAEEVVRRLHQPPRPLPGPRRGRRLVAAAVAFGIFASATVIWWALDDPRPPVPASDPWAWVNEGWTQLPAPPEWRDGAAVVWTGSALVYWGGVPRGATDAEAASGGFTFNSAAKAWSPMPAAPFGLARAHGVWTGREVLVWGERDPLQGTEVPKDDLETILAFDATAGTWRQLEPSPHLPPWGGTSVWTGELLVAFGGGRPDDASAVSGAVLAPEAGVWRQIAPAPLPMSLANAVWTGDEVVVLGAALDTGNHSTTRTAVAQAYRPSTDTWRVLPDPPLSPQSSELVLLGDRVIAWDYGSGSAEYLVDEDRWRGLGQIPLDHGECYVDGAAVEGAAFAWNCGYPDAWYPDAGWRDVDGGPAPEVPVSAVIGQLGYVVPAGEVVVVQQIDTIDRRGEVFVGDETAPVHLWVWRAPQDPPPPRLPSDADVEALVSGFLTAWYPGDEVYLPTVATADVIDRCKRGTDGIPSLEGWTFRSWNTRQPVEISPGVYDIRVELRLEGEVAETVVFTVGPGSTSDGRSAPLVIVDVRPAG